MADVGDLRTDEQLVDACNRGDAAAFEALYVRHRDWALRLAWRLTGHREDALDVLQDTFAYFLTKFPGFRLTAKLTTFLYPAVRNLAIAARRKRRREPTGAEIDVEAAATEPPEAFATGELGAALAGLSDEHRETLLLRYVDGMSLDEIAAALEIPEGTVKSRLHAAVESLRRDPRTKRYFGS